MVVAREKPYRILIVDDDHLFRETLKAVFEPYLDLCEAACGEEAIDIVRHEPVHVMLLDMHMGVLTGLETLHIVKGLHALLPCILVTADATAQLRRDANEAQAFSVLAKPVRRRELVSTVSSALADTYHDHDVTTWLGGRNDWN